MYKPSGFRSRKSTFMSATAVRSAIKAQRASTRRMKPAMVVVPGITRTGGAYRRSNPQNHEETHYNDCTFTNSAGTTGTTTTFTSVSPSSASPDNPAVQSLCGIKQGTTKNTRIGNKIHMYQIRMQGQIALPNSMSGDMIRLVLVLDKQANGATAAPSDVFETTAASTTGVFAFRNMDNIDRFQILKDKKYNLNPTVGVSGTSNTVLIYHWKMSHKGKWKIDYSSTNGAISELKSNNILMFAFCSEGTGALVTGISRVYWKE